MSSNIRVNSITPSVGNSVAIGTAGGTIVFNCPSSGPTTFSGDVTLSSGLDVDGHTELDNVNVSGIITASRYIGDADITGGSIVATAATFTGNVSIAGTLTYEDVTNVDSVGIITAQSGIQLTGGDFVLSGVGQSIGIGTASPRVAIDAAETTNAIALPQGTTAQRPTGDNPYIRWNTSNSALEVYNGTDWVEIITDYFPTGSVILG